MARKVRDQRGAEVKLTQALDEAPVLGSDLVYIAGNSKHKARWAKMEFRATSITLVRPREGATAFVMDHDIREIPTSIVDVREIKPPNKAAAVRWVIYTKESVSSFSEVHRVVDYYEQRPLIDEFHECVKDSQHTRRFYPQDVRRCG